MANLSLVDKTGTCGNELGKRCTLLEWHAQDPVSDWERRRNERIYEQIAILLLITLNGQAVFTEIAVEKTRNNMASF